VVKPFFGAPIEDEDRFVRETVVKALRKAQVTPNPKDNVAIGVTDSTRPTPNSKMLPALLDELKRLGVREEKVTILIATGMHGPDNADEIKRNLGQEVLKRVKVMNHDPDDQENFRCLGSTELGTTMEVNKVFVDADFRIITGTVGPCMLAGWTGGGKTVMPGLSSRNSISQNHTLFVKNIRMAKRGAMFGVLRNNLVRQDIDDYAARVGVNLIVNAVQNPDGQALGIYAGTLYETYEHALRESRKAMTITSPEKADIVVASPGVYTHEVSLYQSASRVLGSVEMLVKRGGSIVLVSSCYKGMYEGIEEKEFRRTLLKHRDPDEILQLTEEGKMPSFESCVAYQFAWMTQRYSVTVVTDGVTKQELEEINMAHASTVGKALGTCLNHHGKNANVTVVPYASFTCAK
jgi:nickel-dependent lactate racemase